jgi:hypothetical protein
MRPKTSTRPSKWDSPVARQEFIAKKAKLNMAYLKEALIGSRGDNFRKYPLAQFLKMLSLPTVFPRGRGDRTVRLTMTDIAPSMKKILANYAELRATWSYGNESYKIQSKLDWDKIQALDIPEEDEKAFAQDISKRAAKMRIEIEDRWVEGDQRAEQFLMSLPEAAKQFEKHNLVPSGVKASEYLIATASFPEDQGRYYCKTHTLPKETRRMIWPNVIDIKSATPALFLKICEEISGEKSQTLADYMAGEDIYQSMGLESREANKKAFLRALNKADDSLVIFQEIAVLAALECVSEDATFQEYSAKNQAMFRKNHNWMGQDGDWSQVNRMEIVQYILQVLVNSRETEIVNELQLCIPGSVGLHDGVETTSIPSASAQRDIQKILNTHCLSGTVEVSNE